MVSPLDLAAALPSEADISPPIVVARHSVQLKNPYSAAQRTTRLGEGGNNVFSYPSGMVTGCDLLSDSGTTVMLAKQWSDMTLGDEAYAGNRGYAKLMRTIAEVFGHDFAQLAPSEAPHAFLFHQGRPAERALFQVLGRRMPGQIVPSNGLFDTTGANVEDQGMRSVPLLSPKFGDPKQPHFKGEMDTGRLRRLLEKSSDRIPIIFLTITNNTAGGQPVSMANIRAVHELALEFEIPLFFDACRFAENAWFIQQYEPGYQDVPVRRIVHQMFAYVDGFTMSFKKDGLANMGGGLFLRRGGRFVQAYPDLPEAILDAQIISEGHPSYGGMSGRDIMAIPAGLKTVVKKKYLAHRVGQVQGFGQAMREAGLPVVTPIGGHAVYLDMEQFFADTSLKRSDFGGVSVTILLLARYGHRACELGDFAFGHLDRESGQEVPAELNLVRFAVPRLRYTNAELLNVVAAMKALYDRRHDIPPTRVTHGQDRTLRHFKARFALG